MKTELKVTFYDTTIADELFEENNNAGDISVIITNRYQSDDEAIEGALHWAKAALGIDIIDYDYADVELA